MIFAKKGHLPIKAGLGLTIPTLRTEFGRLVTWKHHEIYGKGFLIHVSMYLVKCWAAEDFSSNIMQWTPFKCIKQINN